MIVQQRPEHLRLITQHDHGILSGLFAAHWKSPEDGARLNDIMILTTELHDYAWVDADRQIKHWRDEELPSDFLTYPEEEKLIIYQRGIDQLARMHPYAGLLLSHHYASFTREERAPMFVQRQQQQRKELIERCHRRGCDTTHILEDFELLKILDVISLIICVAPPDTIEGSWPEWLFPSPLLERRGITAEWSGNTLTLDPYPLDDVIETVVPYRQLDHATARDSAVYLGELPVELQPVRVSPRTP